MDAFLLSGGWILLGICIANFVALIARAFPQFQLVSIPIAVVLVLACLALFASRDGLLMGLGCLGLVALSMGVLFAFL